MEDEGLGKGRLACQTLKAFKTELQSEIRNLRVYEDSRKNRWTEFTLPTDSSVGQQLKHTPKESYT